MPPEEAKKLINEEPLSKALGFYKAYIKKYKLKDGSDLIFNGIPDDARDSLISALITQHLDLIFQPGSEGRRLWDQLVKECDACFYQYQMMED